MGYDYTGGGLSGPNRHMAETIRKLRAGQTSGQQNRALADKALLVGGQAVIGAIGHTIEAMQSQKLQEQQRNADIMRGAIRDQTKQAAAERREADRPSPDYVSNDAVRREGRHEVPAWLAQAQGDTERPDIIAEAAKAQSNQDVNQAASVAKIGGHRSPEGLAFTGEESDMRASDIDTGKRLMRGMMSSIPGPQ